MTKRDTAGLMAMLQTAYPAYYAKQTNQERMEAVNLWADLFANDPPALVYAAVKTIIVSGGAFPPSIGEIKNKMQDLSAPAALSETEAWALVSKAVRNGIYGYREEYDKLPPVVQKAVGTPNQLREWAILDGGELKTVVASNFMRSFRTIQKREKELALIPVDVQKLLAKTAERLMLHE